MDFSTDEQLREALCMMADVRDYLDRLPPVPVTRDFCRKLAAFAGVPLLDAELRGDVLTVRLVGRPDARMSDPAGVSFQLNRD